MKNRNPIAVFIFGFITGGLYSLYWNIATKTEMNERGANIPTAWLLIIPFVNIWWLWKWSQGVEHVTNGKMSGVISFVLELFTGPIGDAIIQDSFNRSTVANPSAGAPVAPVADITPVITPPTNPVG